MMDIITLCVSAAVLAVIAVAFHMTSPAMSDTAKPIFVDTEAKLIDFLQQVADLPAKPDFPSLYCDLEGIDLCRHGSISIFTVYVLPIDKVYLIDVHKLKDKTFATATLDGLTLKSILESDSISKVFFDVRNDSDALFAHYKIALAGIKDLQLMELGSRYGGSEVRKFVTGLARCILRHSKLPPAERARSQQIKENGSKLFAPDKGGRFEVFNQRPLPKAIVDYCAVDVEVLPSLYEAYDAILKRPEKKDWRKRVEKATLERVKESQSAEYKPNGPHKTLGPWQS